MKLSDAIKKAILDLQKHYPEKRSALIPALHLAQSQEGYLPLEIQQEVAELFALDTNEINGVVTFYDMFYDKPMGKHLLHVCKNLSCMLRGSDEILAQLCQKLETCPHQTSEDGNFTIIPSECLGACDLAPMMLVDDRVVGNLKTENLDHIIEEAKRSPGHPSPVELEGKNHA